MVDLLDNKRKKPAKVAGFAIGSSAVPRINIAFSDHHLTAGSLPPLYR
jgi:hypothetical protein